MTENTDLAIRREETFALGRLMPQSVRELAWFAGQASKSGLFQTSAGGSQLRALTSGEAFMLMSTGIELGLTPLQGLRDLSLIKGKVDVPPSVLAAKIASDPRVTFFDPVGDDKAFEITAKRSDRDNGCTVVITWDDISQADQAKHRDHAEDFLYARCVRRIVKRYFPDLKYGLASNVAEESARVIDVATVEKHVGPEKSGQQCEKCGDDMYLHPSRNGGVYSECVTCRHRTSPPQVVRDAVRGRGENFVESDAPNDPTPIKLAGSDADTGAIASGAQAGVTPASPSEPRDPTPEEEHDLSQQWQRNIWQILLENMVDDAPHELHKLVLVNWGWDRKMKVTEWLASQKLDELITLCEELSAVDL